MNYIGSKYSLLPEIENVIRKEIFPDETIEEKSVVDLFAGTCVVSQLFKKMGFKIVQLNDMQFYSVVTGWGSVVLDELPRFDRLINELGFCIEPKKIKTFSLDHRGVKQAQIMKHPAVMILRYLDSLPGKEGRFFHAYCEGGTASRKYFSKENGMKINRVASQIYDWLKWGWVSDEESLWLSACLVESADRVANTASVYAAYLKHVKSSAQNPFQMICLVPVPKQHESQHVLPSYGDARVFEDKNCFNTDLVYIDPPYNHRQYGSNYHILETLAMWDLEDFEPKGRTGLRDWTSSSFCKKGTVKSAFESLFLSLNTKNILLSYSSEGLMPLNDMLGLLSKHFETPVVKKLDYKRFRADNDSENRQYKADSVTEYLIWAKSL